MSEFGSQVRRVDARRVYVPFPKEREADTTISYNKFLVL